MGFRWRKLLAVLVVPMLVSVADGSPLDRELPRRIAGAGPAVAGVPRIPPLGWNSWNSFGCNPSEAAIEAAADELVRSGMRAAGYRYVVVDDCWFAPQRSADGSLRGDPKRFPSGMLALGKYLHARGLRFGIYQSPNSQTCAQHYGGYPGATGSFGHEALDARTFASWGVDFLKYDWCDTETDIRRQITAFTRMRDALRATGRPIVYNINPNSGSTALPPVGTSYDWSTVASMVRTGYDTVPAWTIPTSRWYIAGNGELVPWVGVSQAIARRASAMHDSQSWNDLDMLVIGLPGVAGSDTPGLTPAEERTQFGMWAMLAAPLVAGNYLAGMSERVRVLLTNSAVLAVDQDPMGCVGEPLRGRPEVWVKPLADGGTAVALYNSSDRDRFIALPSGGDLGVSGAVTELWSGARLTGLSGSRLVAAHDTVLLRVGKN